MRAFENSDVLLGPTTPTTAYTLGDWASKGVQSYEDDVFCVPASLAGLPAISLPCGLTSSRYTRIIDVAHTQTTATTLN